MYNHFNKIDKKYIKNIGDKTKIYNSIANRIEPFIKNKVVVDIGGGGKIFYNHKLVKKLIILDQSQEMLNNLEYNEIIKIKQDARNMSKIKDHSVDIILIIFALHHINGKTYNDSIISLQKVLQQINKKLNSGGEIIIIEPTLNSFFYFLQKILYKFTFLILKLFKTDMVFFFKDKILIENLKQINNKAQINCELLPMSGWLDPLLGTFPGLIKIPSFLMPTRMKIFYVKKIN